MRTSLWLAILGLPLPALAAVVHYVPPSTVVDSHFTAAVDPQKYPAAIPLNGGKYLLVQHYGESLQRLNADGSIDSTYSLDLVADSVIALPDGRFLAYVAPGVPGLDPFSFQRLNADGTLDPSFQTDSALGEPIPLADGRMVRVAISSSNVATLIRLNADGSSDSTYPPTSLVLPPTSTGWDWSLNLPAFARDRENRTYVAARGNVFRLSAGSAYIFRLNADGSLDSSFTPFSLNHGIAALWAFQDKLCYDTGSDFYSPFIPYWGHTFARINLDGTPDPSFPAFTYANHGTGPTDASPYGVVPLGFFDADGGLIVEDFGAVSQGLIRYDSTGQRDYAFSARLDDSVKSIQGFDLLPDGSIFAYGSFTAMNGVATSGAAPLIPTRTAYTTRLVNVSILGNVGAGDQTLIVGFIVGGSTSSLPVLVRGVGPGLVPMWFSNSAVLPDPHLTLFADSTAIGTNDDWNASLTQTAASLGAFPLTPGSKDSALMISVAPGNHSALITGATSAPTGFALAELYDAGGVPVSVTTARLRNVSGRGQVGGGVMLSAGFVIDGSATKRVLVRAVGPTLVSQGVAAALPDSKLTLFHLSTPIASNDNWSSDDAVFFDAVGAFALDADSKDAALVIDLPPGVYSARVESADNRAGIALVEAYEIP